MLALWILLGLCAFLALLLLLPLHIYLAFTPEAGFSFYARYAFLTIRPDSEPNEKLMEQVFTLLGLRDVSSTANARSAVSAKGVAATLCELGAVLRTLLGRVFWLLHRGTSRRFSLHIAVGAGDPADAALDYGMVCAALYPVLGLLQSAIRFRRPDIAVTCTEEPQTNVEFSAKFSLRAILIVRAFFHLLAENARQHVAAPARSKARIAAAVLPALVRAADGSPVSLEQHRRAGLLRKRRSRAHAVLPRQPAHQAAVFAVVRREHHGTGRAAQYIYMPLEHVYAIGIHHNGICGVHARQQALLFAVGGAADDRAEQKPAEARQQREIVAAAVEAAHCRHHPPCRRAS